MYLKPTISCEVTASVESELKELFHFYFHKLLNTCFFIKVPLRQPLPFANFFLEKFDRSFINLVKFWIWPELDLKKIYRIKYYWCALTVLQLFHLFIWLALYHKVRVIKLYRNTLAQYLSSLFKTNHPEVFWEIPIVNNFIKFLGKTPMM